MEHKTTIKTNYLIGFDFFKQILIMKTTNSFFFLLFISSLCVALTSFLVPFIVLLFLLIVAFAAGEKFILGLVPVMFLVLIADITVEYRSVLVFGLMIVLLFCFIVKFKFYISRYPILPAPITNTLLMFCFAMIISASSSYFPMRGIDQILRVSAFLIIYYILTSLIDSIDKLKVILNSMIIAGIVLSLGILQEFIRRGFTIVLDGNAIFRLGGLFGNANFVSVPIFIACTLSVAFIINTENSKRKILYFISTLLNLVALLLNNSRSSLLAIFVVVVIILFFMYRKRLRYIFLTFLFVFIILLLFTEVIEFFEFYFRLEHVGSGREKFWSMALSTFLDNPLLGAGPGAFKFMMYRYLPVQLGSWDEQIISRLISITDLGYQHNFFLMLASEMGTIGLLAGSLMIYNFTKYGLESIKKLRIANSRDTIFCIACFAIGFGLFFRGLFEAINIFSFGWLSADLPFWLLFFVLLKFPNFIKVKNSI